MTTRRCDQFSTDPVSYDLTDFTAEIACTLILSCKNRPYMLVTASPLVRNLKFLHNVLNGDFRLHVEREVC